MYSIISTYKRREPSQYTKPRVNQMIYINQLTVIASFAATVRDTITTAIAIVKHLLVQEAQSPWFIETNTDEYEDYWTENLAVHRVELSDGRKLPVLCESPSHAWDKIENWLFEANDFQTSILKITRDEW